MHLFDRTRSGCGAPPRSRDRSRGRAGSDRSRERSRQPARHHATMLLLANAHVARNFRMSGDMQFWVTPKAVW